MGFRLAKESDVDSITAIYDLIHGEEEKGNTTCGWKRGIYPVKSTAEQAVKRGDMFVLEENGEIVASGIMNSDCNEVYHKITWNYPCKDEEALILHTLTVSPKHFNKGYGKKFFEFYENFAREHGYSVLRIDTQAKNLRARAIYKKLGYIEADIVPCDFCGIKNIQLVLLEKKVTV